jgi:RNA polymerase sigma-70 factor (sigma-E family)
MRDAEYAEYVSARATSLRRLALLLSQDWHRADDLVQTVLMKLYMHWARAAAADNIDAYVRGMLVREFLRERRSGWSRRVSPTDELPELPELPTDKEGLLDLQAAVAVLPPRQRAVLVLRFYCDLNIEQSARILGCTPGTVKSQTAKALVALRSALLSPAQTGSASETRDAADRARRSPRKVPDNA